MLGCKCHVARLGTPKGRGWARALPAANVPAGKRPAEAHQENPDVLRATLRRLDERGLNGAASGGRRCEPPNPAGLPGGPGGQPGATVARNLQSWERATGMPATPGVQYHEGPRRQLGRPEALSKSNHRAGIWKTRNGVAT
jgi:hypothetical protein